MDVITLYSIAGRFRVGKFLGVRLTEEAVEYPRQEMMPEILAQLTGSNSAFGRNAPRPHGKQGGTMRAAKLKQDFVRGAHAIAAGALGWRSRFHSD